MAFLSQCQIVEVLFGQIFVKLLKKAKINLQTNHNFNQHTFKKTKVSKFCLKIKNQLIHFLQENRNLHFKGRLPKPIRPQKIAWVYMRLRGDIPVLYCITSGAATYRPQSITVVATYRHLIDCVK